MRYFNISVGMRGVYMPDTSYVIGCATRRELKAAIENEAIYMRNVYTGANKLAVRQLAAEAWRNKSIYDSVMPLKPIGSRDAFYGLFVSNATRADLEAQEAQEH